MISGRNCWQWPSISWTLAKMSKTMTSRVRTMFAGKTPTFVYYSFLHSFGKYSHFWKAFVFDSGVLQRSPLQHHWSHFEVGGLAWKRSAQQASKTIPQRCICFIHFQQLQIIFSGGNCSPWRKAGELLTRKGILGRYIPLFDLYNSILATQSFQRRGPGHSLCILPFSMF